MIIVDQLRISDDGNRLYINVHVNKAEYFDNIAIDSISIMTSDKVSETDPNSPVVSDCIYRKIFVGNDTREAALVLTANDLVGINTADMTKTLFFVYIKCKGIPGECTPCRLDEETTLAVTFDENMLYQRVMNYTKELNRDCNISTDFIDFILLWNAFKASIETEHYIPAIKYFNMLFDIESEVDSISRNCGCNG